MEAGGNNRSVMPFDVLGCTRATMMQTVRNLLSRDGWLIVNLRRAGDRALQLLLLNEEFLVSACH
jgi:hypothetical protein